MTRQRFLRARIFIVVLAMLAIARPAAVDASQEQVPEYQNAGVLPYSTSSGEIRVLLGLDGEEETWSDFVGVCTPGETPASTAAREFVEETREAFPLEQVVRRLEGIEPVTMGPTRIFLLEVPDTSAAQIGRLTKGRYTEKDAYCWVSVQELLQSIDTRGTNRAQVPTSCGGGSSELFDLVGANLAQGQPLRQQLLTAFRDGEPPVSSESQPRCGR